jgi:hypothetical protein
MSSFFIYCLTSMTVTKDENPGSRKITLAIYRSEESQIQLLSLLLFFLSPVFL